MVNLLSVIQLVLAILLIFLVLVQRANTDASGAFGADGGAGTTFQKRGAEKTLHTLTIVVAILFVLSLSYSIIVA